MSEFTPVPKKTNAAQKRWCHLYQDETGFELMYHEMLDSGEIDFEEFARMNISWYEDHTSDMLLRIGDFPQSKRHFNAELKELRG